MSDSFADFLKGSSLGAELFADSDLFSGFDFGLPPDTGKPAEKKPATSSSLDLLPPLNLSLASSPSLSLSTPSSNDSTPLPPPRTKSESSKKSSKPAAKSDKSTVKSSKPEVLSPKPAKEDVSPAPEKSSFKTMKPEASSGKPAKSDFFTDKSTAKLEPTSKSSKSENSSVKSDAYQTLDFLKPLKSESESSRQSVLRSGSDASTSSSNKSQSTSSATGSNSWKPSIPSKIVTTLTQIDTPPKRNNSEKDLPKSPAPGRRTSGMKALASPAPKPTNVKDDFDFDDILEEFGSKPATPLLSPTPSSSNISTPTKNVSGNRESSNLKSDFGWGSMPRSGSPNTRREPIPVKDATRAMDFEKLLSSKDTVKLTSTPDRLKNIEIKKDVKLEAKPPTTAKKATSRLAENILIDSDSEFDEPKEKRGETLYEFLKNTGPEDLQPKTHRPKQPSNSTITSKSSGASSAQRVNGQTSSRILEADDEDIYSSGDEEIFGPRVAKSPQKRDQSLIDFLRSEPPPTEKQVAAKKKKNTGMKIFGTRRAESGPELNASSPPSPTFQPPVNGTTGNANGKRNIAFVNGNPERLPRSNSQPGRYSDDGPHSPRPEVSSSPVPPVPPVPLKYERSKSEPAPIDRVSTIPPPSVPQINTEIVQKILKAKEADQSRPNRTAEKAPESPRVQSTSLSNPKAPESPRMQSASFPVLTTLQKLQNVQYPGSNPLAGALVTQTPPLTPAMLDITDDASSQGYPEDFSDTQSMRSNNYTDRYSMLSDRSSQFNPRYMSSQLTITPTPLADLISSSQPMDRVAKGLGELDKDFQKLFEDYSPEPSSSNGSRTGTLQRFKQRSSVMSNSYMRLPIVNEKSEIGIQCGATHSETGVQTSVSGVDADMQTEFLGNDVELQTDIAVEQSHVDVQTTNEYQQNAEIQCRFIGSELVTTNDIAVQTIFDVLVVEDIPLDEEEEEGEEGLEDVWQRRRFSNFRKNKRSSGMSLSNEIPYGDYSSAEITPAYNDRMCENCAKQGKYETERFVDGLVRNTVDDILDRERPSSVSPTATKSEVSDLSEKTVYPGSHHRRVLSGESASLPKWVVPVSMETQTESVEIETCETQTSQNEFQHNVEVQFNSKIPMSESAVQTTLEFTKNAHTQSQKLMTETVDCQTDSSLMSSYIRTQTESSNVYMMLIQENTRLHEETTQLKLALADERARNQAMDAERAIMESKFEQLARLAHTKLREALDAKRHAEMEANILANHINSQTD